MIGISDVDFFFYDRYCWAYLRFRKGVKADIIENINRNWGPVVSPTSIDTLSEYMANISQGLENYLDQNPVIVAGPGRKINTGRSSSFERKVGAPSRSVRTAKIKESERTLDNIVCQSILSVFVVKSPGYEVFTILSEHISPKDEPELRLNCEKKIIFQNFLHWVLNIKAEPKTLLNEKRQAYIQSIIETMQTIYWRRKNQWGHDDDAYTPHSYSAQFEEEMKWFQGFCEVAINVFQEMKEEIRDYPSNCKELVRKAEALFMNVESSPSAKKRAVENNQDFKEREKSTPGIDNNVGYSGLIITSENSPVTLTTDEMISSHPGGLENRNLFSRLIKGWERRSSSYPHMGIGGGEANQDWNDESPRDNWDPNHSVDDTSLNLII